MQREREARVKERGGREREGGRKGEGRVTSSFPCLPPNTRGVVPHPVAHMNAFLFAPPRLTTTRRLDKAFHSQHRSVYYSLVRAVCQPKHVVLYLARKNPHHTYRILYQVFKMPHPLGLFSGPRFSKARGAQYENDGYGMISMRYISINDASLGVCAFPLV